MVARTGPTKILVVDDDVRLRDLLTRYLGEQGFQVAALPDARDLDRKLAFLDFAPRHFICARDGKGVAAVLKSVGEVFAAAMVKLPTPRLTRTLQMAVARQQPPRAGLVRRRLF